MSVYDRFAPPPAPDLRTLIFPTIDLVGKAAKEDALDPCAVDWEELIATQGHWRLKCIRHLKDMGNGNLDPRNTMAPRFQIMKSVEARRDACATLPTAWKNFCPSPTAWTELGEERVKELYNDRKCVTFHKAVLVYWLLARHVQCHLQRDPNDVFDTLKIAPLIYTIDGFNDDFFAKLNLAPSIKTKIAKLVGGDILNRLERHPKINLTYCGASDLYKFLSPLYPSISGVTIANNRLKVGHQQKIWC